MGLFRIQLNQNEGKDIKLKAMRGRNPKKKFEFRSLIPHLIVRLGCGLTFTKAL